MDRAAPEQRKICASCNANRHGGCVEPKSPIPFDQQPDPYGSCGQWKPLQINTNRIQGG
jgi:hypothetical protein